MIRNETISKNNIAVCVAVLGMVHIPVCFYFEPGKNRYRAACYFMAGS